MIEYRKKENNFIDMSEDDRKKNYINYFFN